MKKFKIINSPMEVSELHHHDEFDEMSNGWELKAERLIARRMKKLRQQML